MTDLANRAREAHSLWHHNPVLVHLFGLTPLLALSTTVLLGATLLLTLAALLIVATAVSGLLLAKINASWRFLFHLGLLALLTTAISALLAIWAPALHAAIGIYLPLLGCSLLPLLHLQTAQPGTGSGTRLQLLARLLGGYGLVVMILAGLREVLTYGDLLTDTGMLMADTAPGVAPALLPFAATPAAGFMLLGLLAAAAAWLRQYTGPAQPTVDVEPAARARVTEKLQ